MTSAPGLRLLLGLQIMLQCQILHGMVKEACWWGDPLGRACKLMQEVRTHHNRCVPWRYEHTPGCCP
eukprot:1150370-Pelagomonas_calceolata.AAC.3